MTMPAKKNSKKTKNAASREEQVRAELSKKTPMRLHKYAVGVLNIPAEVVDSWNDYDFMVDYCVKKTLGLELPEEPKKKAASLDNEGEFDASDMVDGDEEDSEDGDFDDEREPGNDSFDFSAGEDSEDEEGEDDEGDGEEEEAEEEFEPEPEPEPKKTRRTRGKKEPVKEQVSAGDDVSVAIGQLLDVITNQGVALETLQKSNARIESMCKEMYIRQEASHGAISTIGKTVFSMSTMLSEFVPRVFSVFRFKRSVATEIRNKADKAGVDAKELFDSLMEPEEVD